MIFVSIKMEVFKKVSTKDESDLLNLNIQAKLRNDNSIYAYKNIHKMKLWFMWIKLKVLRIIESKFSQ